MSDVRIGRHRHDSPHRRTDYSAVRRSRHPQHPVVTREGEWTRSPGRPRSAPNLQRSPSAAVRRACGNRFASSSSSRMPTRASPIFSRPPVTATRGSPPDGQTAAGRVGQVPGGGPEDVSRPRGRRRRRLDVGREAWQRGRRDGPYAGTADRAAPPPARTVPRPGPKAARSRPRARRGRAARPPALPARSRRRLRSRPADGPSRPPGASGSGPCRWRSGRCRRRPPPGPGADGADVRGDGVGDQRDRPRTQLPGQRARQARRAGRRPGWPSRRPRRPVPSPDTPVSAVSALAMGTSCAIRCPGSMPRAPVRRPRDARRPSPTGPASVTPAPSPAVPTTTRRPEPPESTARKPAAHGRRQSTG